MKKGRVALDLLESNLLRHNPLNDPGDRILPVYLPPSYDIGSTEYPWVVCLAGFTGSGRSWFNFQAWIPSIDERMDRLIAEGMPEMVLVFPDCFTRYGGSQYLDSIAVGAYRSYIIEEILPFVEQRFRVRRDRRFRGVMGKSSGGYGAITMAMDHPGLFSAVACHSGDMYFEYAYTQEFPAAQRKLEKMGGLSQFLKRFDEFPKTGKDDHAVLDLIAMSACYSPNPNTLPHLFDLPFEEWTGRMREDVWARWKKHDPVEIVKQNGKSLKEFGLVYLDCGRRDEFALDMGARMFCAELAKQGIGHQYEEFEDGHFNIQYRYDVSLRKMAEYFQRSG